MTIETKASEKGRISYFGNGSQTRLGTIVDVQFTFDVQRFATTDIVTAAIENLPDDMKDEVRAKTAIRN